jgi:hypothetical protein
MSEIQTHVATLEPIRAVTGHRTTRRSRGLLWTISLLCAGCSTPPGSTFEIVNYRGPGHVERLHETFDDAFYDVDEHGNVNIILRRITPDRNDPSATIVQFIHLKTFWRSIPGRTIAERTQINGTVHYCIWSGPIVATFDGAGSLFCEVDEAKGTLSGALELARLKPKHQDTHGEPLFERAELSGAFSAKRDSHRVVAATNEIARLFPPEPAKPDVPRR